MPTVGYQGFKSQYRMPTVAINHRKDPFFNINPLRPRLKETAFEQEGEPTVSTQRKTAESILDATGDMKVPVSGYTGHRMGYRA